MTIVVVRRQKRIIMEGSASSINSGATAIKTILLAAWRGKLSNEEWEARIRKVLRGDNGDVYNLADCLLKQALVGPVPNQLFISYLKHAVYCELVSHGAVLSSIANQSTTNIRPLNLAHNKTSSVICLLEFLKSFRDRISCKGTELECLNLCHSINQLTHWILKCIQHSLESVTGTTSLLSSNATNINANPSGPVQTSQHESISAIVELCTEAIHYFINKPFTRSLLFISKIEYSEEFDDILRTAQVIQQLLTSCPSLEFIQDKIQHCKIFQQLSITFNSNEMHPSVVAAQQLRCLQRHRIRSTHVIAPDGGFEKKTHLFFHDSSTNHALFNSFYSLVAFDVLLRLARSPKLLARQIDIVTNFNNAPISMAYCELIRVCMIGLVDSEGPAKLNWNFFSFLKMPKLLIELSKAHKSHLPQDSSSYITTFIKDLKLAFERLCQYSPLLDEAECKVNCDFFRCLVRELINNDPNLMQLKNVDFKKFLTKRANTNINEGSISGDIVLRVEPHVKSIFQNCNTAHDPNELFTELGNLVAGNQFEFILSAAASIGRLQMFVKRLIEINELYKMPRHGSPGDFPVQALIFDITFLILTFIAKKYGPDVIGMDQRTTFNKWFLSCCNHGTRINCPKEMLKNSNADIVTSLIKQLVQPEGDLQMQSVNWKDVCANVPKATKEILTAWNQGCLNDSNLNVVMERLKSRMCSVAVVTATWLQCHIKTLNEADKARPLSLLLNLTKASQQAKQRKQTTNDIGLKSDSYSERSSLMCSIIRKIYFELDPKAGIASRNPSNSNTVVNMCTDADESLEGSAYQSINGRFASTLTTQEIFLANVKQCLNSGWIDHKSLISLSSLFKMIGSECFTNLIVEQILTSHESPSDLRKAVNITFGLFHLDLEACAFALLKNTIPSWLMGEKKQGLLYQPRAFALAHLTVMTIVEVFDNLRTSQLNGNRPEDKKLTVNGIKQEPGIQKTILLDTVDPPGSLNGPSDAKRIKLAHDNSEKELSQDVSERLEKLNECIADLMKLFKEITSDPVMSQRTLFPVLFLQQIVICTREDSKAITVHLEPEILLDIINLFSSELTFELVLAISNFSTTMSRRFAAKAMCQLAQVKESKQNQAQAYSFRSNKMGFLNQPDRTAS